MKSYSEKRIINGKTKLYGLIGNPVEHSFSPVIHNFLFEHYKLNKIYTAFKIGSPLDGAICGIKGLGIKGFNVTSPYKEEIIKHLDWISELARVLDAVNTVKNINGKLYGFNSDFFGIVKSLSDNDVDLKGKKAVVFGGGVIARTVAHALEFMGIENMVILNRTPEKARDILKNIKQRRNSFNYGELNNRNVNNQLNNVDIIINATSIDVMGDKNFFLDWERVHKETVFYDVLYNPQTNMTTLADKTGFKVISGIDMLIWQALKSFQIWTGIWPQKDKNMYLAIKEHIGKRLRSFQKG